MGPYTSTKAGVEALTDALRMETAPTGARIGCAYFGFIDTDMVRGSFSQPSTQALNKRLPSFMRNPTPLPQAIDAIERGIERRVSRLWAPRWIGPMLALRGILQPLTERRMLGEPDVMTEAIHLAASSHETDTQDPLLGGSHAALYERASSARRRHWSAMASLMRTPVPWAAVAGHPQDAGARSFAGPSPQCRRRDSKPPTRGL